MSTANPPVSAKTRKSMDLEAELQDVDREIDDLQRRLDDFQRAESIAADAVEMQALELEIQAACDAFDEAAKSRWAPVWGEIEDILAESEEIRVHLQEAQELGSKAPDTPPALRTLTVPPILEREMPHRSPGTPLDGPAYLRRVLVRGPITVGGPLGVDARWARRNGLTR